MNTAVTVAVIAALSGIIGGVISCLSGIVLHKVKHKDERKDRRDDWEQHVDECLANDNKRLDAVEAEGKLVLRALMAVLGHMEDGNHTGELSERRKDIERYLIER